MVVDVEGGPLSTVSVRIVPTAVHGRVDSHIKPVLYPATSSTTKYYVISSDSVFYRVRFSQYTHSGS